MKTTSSKIFFALLILSLGILNGCNTVNGFGQDVSATGHGIQKAAD
jgi:predicted small secreted protein